MMPCVVGHLRHCRSLYDEELRVPLLVRPPRGGGGEGAPPTTGRPVGEPVALLDVMPTILDYAGIEAGIADGAARRAVGVAGRSLRRFVEAPVAGAAEPGRLPQPILATAGTRRALVLGSWKLIHDLDDGSSRLYDLAADPIETTDRAATEPDTVRTLLTVLDRRLRADEGEGLTASRPRLDLSRETEQQLRALGYLQ